MEIQLFTSSNMENKINPKYNSMQYKNSWISIKMGGTHPIFHGKQPDFYGKQPVFHDRQTIFHSKQPILQGKQPIFHGKSIIHTIYSKKRLEITY